MNIVELINSFKDPVLIESLSFGDKITASLFVTLLGMTITFAALIVLWGLTATYSKMIRRTEDKSKQRAIVHVDAASQIEPVKAESDSSVELGNGVDDYTLVAIVTAAVAASLGTSRHNIVVRSIARAVDPTPAWGQAGRMIQMNNRL